MNATETAHLVNLIVSTWPTGPRGHIWTAALAELNHQPALDTYTELRDTHDKPPSVATFKALYRGRTAPTSSSPPSRCELCDGTGWVEGPGHQALGHWYTNVVHCKCRR